MKAFSRTGLIILRHGRAALLACLALAMSACGGGGDGNNNGGNQGGNSTPTANAGADQNVDELGVVQLIGMGNDLDGDTLSYSWAQTAGTGVTITNGNTAMASFTAPDVVAGSPEMLTFQLTVSDGMASSTDSVNVTVAEPQVQVMVSGTVNYEFVPPEANCSGLNFAGTFNRPIRGATVQLLDSGNNVLSTMIAGDDGSYAFNNIDANTIVRLRVRAELQQAGTPGWDVEVRDNFIAGASDSDVPAPPALGTRALYTLDGVNFDTGTSNITQNLTAASGWGVNSYTGSRAAAPFAILDVIYTAMQFVRSADASANFQPLDAFWSVNNTVADADIDITAGNLPTSFYNGVNSLFILGDDMDDTDEFDDHIVAHEWSHYFEDNFSRSDSFGGPHSLDERLDASLSFGEGWASALGAMLLNDPIYCDTGVPGTSAGFGFSAEGSSFSTKGWFNESSVFTIIYDLWDSANDDGDNGSIGFAPIYDVMTGPQIFTEGFTTLFSFTTELRASLNAQGQALVDALLNRENVVSGVALDIWGSNETNDAGAPPAVSPLVLPLYTPYTADGSVLEVCVDDYFDRLSGLNRDGNNPGAGRYLRITVPTDDEYEVSVVTTTPTPPSADPDDRDQSDPDIYIMRGAAGGFIAAGTEGVANLEPPFRTPMLFAAETYAAIVEEWRFDDVEASDDFPPQICFDVSFTPTP